MTANVSKAVHHLMMNITAMHKMAPTRLIHIEYHLKAGRHPIKRTYLLLIRIIKLYEY